MKKLLVLFIILEGVFSYAEDGKFYFTKGSIAYHNRHYKKAAKLFKKSCYMENANGCNAIGFLYDKGIGVRQSYKQAKAFYIAACDMRSANGCNNLGFLYEYGLGVRQNYKKAKKLFGRACDMGSEAGCRNYAHLNRRGF